MMEFGTKAFATQNMVAMKDIYLVGIKTRTNNQQEANPKDSKIGQTIARFWRENISEQIPNGISPGRTFSVYTEYDSDEHGDYTYFYGQQVDSHEQVPEGLEALIIPTAHYQRFTTAAGPMPKIVIELWQEIWQMSEEKLGGKRAYVADFEIYDERATDPQNSIVDVYIGVK